MWQSLAGAVAAVGMMFGGGASSTGDHRPPRMGDDRHMGSTTRPFRGDGQGEGPGDHGMRGAFGGMGSTTGTVDVACISTAVAAREAAMSTGVTTLNTSITAAYTSRASALAAAYTSTDPATVKAAIKTAWQQFKGATQAGKKAWQSTRTTAWSDFKTALKSCGGNSTALSDAGNAGSEVSGQ